MLHHCLCYAPSHDEEWPDEGRRIGQSRARGGLEEGRGRAGGVAGVGPDEWSEEWPEEGRRRVGGSPEDRRRAGVLLHSLRPLLSSNIDLSCQPTYSMPLS